MRETSRSASLSLLFPSFAGLALVLILLRSGDFADPLGAATAWVLVGLSALAAAWAALRIPRLSLPITVFGSVALLFATYSAISTLAPWLIPEDREWFLLRIDRLWLGYTWEGWWAGIQNPVLSDLLQAVYTSFYGFPLILGIYLYLKRDRDALLQGVDRMVLGFLLSYCGYLLVPSRSPYPFVEYPGAIPSFGLQAILHTEVIETSWTKRDCFPSGHTMMSMYVAWLAWVRARPVFWVLGPWAFLTMTATLYLRYHYLIDVIVGIAAFAAWVFLSERLYGKFRDLPRETATQA